jgi:hypothetical protein
LLAAFFFQPPTDNRLRNVATQGDHRSTDTDPNRNDSMLSAGLADFIAKHATCQVSFTVNNTPSAANKLQQQLPTLWVPHLPSALPDGIFKNLVTAMTGIQHAAKQHYATSPGYYKHCKGKATTTVLCTLLHPQVPMHPPPNDNRFSRNYVFILRNPITLFPASANAKAIRYHNHTSQVPNTHWQSTRDVWINTMMETYERQVVGWLKMTNLTPKMFLVQEEIMVPATGPETITELARVLREEGYAVANDADMSCIWYTAMGRTTLEHYDTYKYEYSDYVPCYKPKQIQLILHGLQRLQDIAKITNHPKWASIMARNQRDILANSAIVETY